MLLSFPFPYTTCMPAIEEMTMDGSFSVKSALERFLARCPKLLSFPKFDSLAKKVFSLFGF